MASTITISVALAQAGAAEKTPPLTAYAFDADGTLIAQADVADGTATLTTTGRAKAARVLVGSLPDLGPDHVVTVEDLARAQAFEVTDTLRPKLDVTIPSERWKPWFWRLCLVQGRVVTPTQFGPFTIELPVCEATVHIYEVDRFPWIIDQIPSDLIHRLGRELVDTLANPVPIPDPGPLAPQRLNPAQRLNPVLGLNPALAVDPTVHLNARTLDTSAVLDQAAGRIAQAPTPSTQPRTLRRSDAVALPLEVHTGLLSDSDTAVRATLKANPALLIPNLCRFPWLWGWFTTQQIGTAVTDDDGHFSHLMFLPAGGDQPDLYFAVEAQVGGGLDWVYRPPVGCTTLWDYACGSEVVLRVTDPRVHGCLHRPPAEGRTVTLRGVGDIVRAGQIGLRGTGAPDPHEGKCWYDLVFPGGTDPGLESPFTATVDLRVDFGVDLPSVASHYAWSVRPLGSTSEADWVKLALPISRHYDTTAVPAEQKLVQVGPDPTEPGVFTKIVPDAPVDLLVWHPRATSIDEASAYLDTTSLPLPPGGVIGEAVGSYELKLELFTKSGGAMTRVDLTDAGIRTFQVNGTGPLTGDITPDELLAANAADSERLLIDGAGHVVGMRLVLHVDNRACTGHIDDVTVDGVLAGRCGFLEYATNGIVAASATLAFQADQPDHHGIAGFGTSRVATPLPSESETFALTAAPVNFALVGSTYSRTTMVTALLSEALPPDETPCERAAFASTLSVWHSGTDGYGRAQWLDYGQELKAFAVTPITGG